MKSFWRTNFFSTIREWDKKNILINDLFGDVSKLQIWLHSTISSQMIEEISLKTIGGGLIPILMKLTPLWTRLRRSLINQGNNILVRIINFLQKKVEFSFISFLFRCRGVVEWINSLIFDVILLITEAATNLWLANALGQLQLISQYRAIIIMLMLPFENTN